MSKSSKIDQLESALILNASSPDTNRQAVALLDLAWHVAEVRTDLSDLPSKLLQNEQSLKMAISAANGWQIAQINKTILSSAVLPYATAVEAESIRTDLTRIEFAGRQNNLVMLFMTLAKTWRSSLSVNQKAGRVIIDVDDSNGRSLQAFHVGAHTRISFQRTLRVPEDGREYPLPADMGTLPVYRIEDYADKVPPHWLEEGGFFIPLYQREALYVSFGGVTWRPTVAKVAVGRINAITGKPYDERIRQHEQDYVIIPDQKWLDGINSGKNTVNQFVAMPLGQGYTVEEQMTDEAKYGGFQLVVFEPKHGRFPDADPSATKSRAQATAIRRLRPRLDEIVKYFQEPMGAVARAYLEDRAEPVIHDGKRLEAAYQIAVLKSVRTYIRQQLTEPTLDEPVVTFAPIMPGWSDEDIETFANRLLRDGILCSAPVSLAMSTKRVNDVEMGIARGGSIKQQILRDHYGGDVWDESAKRRLIIRIVNSAVFQQITGDLPPQTPVNMEAYRQARIPWFQDYEETAQTVAPAKKLSIVKGIAAIARLRGKVHSEEHAPIEITPDLLKRIHTPSRSERIKDLLVRAESSWTAKRFSIAHREASLVLALIENSQDGHFEEKKRVLCLRASSSNKLHRYYEAEADATDLLDLVRKSSVVSARKQELSNADFIAEIHRDLASAYALRSYSYLRLADYELAISDCTQAIQSDPSCMMAHEVMAEALLWTNQTDGAFTKAEQVLAVMPQSSMALIVRGECWRRLGNPIYAVTDLTQALQAGGPDAVAYATRAEAFAVLGRPQDARHDLEAALKLEPGYEFARELLARLPA